MSDPTRIQLQIDPPWDSQVEPDALRAAVLRALELEGAPPDASLTLIVVGDETMTAWHEEYRHEPGTTDVLTFPTDPADNYDDPDLAAEMTGYLGDVVLCYEQAARQAAEEGHDAAAEMQLLAVHGVLHLLGYDDEEPNARHIMWERQRRVLAALGLERIAPREAADDEA